MPARAFPNRSNTARCPRCARLETRTPFVRPRALLSAERPMIWAGQGVLYSEASDELTAVAEYLGAPVMTTLLGKSGFNERHPLALGTGSHSRTDMVVDALARCDLIFGIGCSLSRSIFAPVIPDGRTILHATLDRCDLNKDYRADVPVLGDARLVLTQLLEERHAQHGSEGNPRRAEVEHHLATVRATWKAR